MSDKFMVAIIQDDRPVMIPVFGLELAKATAMWGTYGKGGIEHCGGRCAEHPLVWKRLVDCETEHLIAILRTQPQVWESDYVKIILSILKDRGESWRVKN